MEKQRPLFEIMSSGSKRKGLSDEQWLKLEVLSKDPDPQVRLETIVAIGGVAKKGEQAQRAAAHLRSLLNDNDETVREGAASFLSLFEQGDSR